MNTLRRMLIDKTKRFVDVFESLDSIPGANDAHKRVAKNTWPELSEKDAFARYLSAIEDNRLAYDLALSAKTILFSDQQADIFLNTDDKYVFSVDYKLPFPSVIIEFSSPLSINTPHGVIKHYGLALMQHEQTKERIDRLRRNRDLKREYFDYTSEAFIEGKILNGCMLVAGDLALNRIVWFSDSTHELIDDEFEEDPTHPVMVLKRLIKKLAICCIGYINCENVYLEKQGEVPEAVNRKREAKGKSRLEPYYVCRIKGVQHDSHATGTGVKHGIRYDVRGHFRRLDTGKTIWVRPHQRGLQNELYIPKVYKVEKGSKPAFNGKEG